MKAFGSEPENRKRRTPTENHRRMIVLAMRTVSEGNHGPDATEALKTRCARERLTYDSYTIEAALRRAHRFLS